MSARQFNITRDGAPDRDTDRTPALEASVARIPGWHIAVLFALVAAQIGCGIWTSIASSDTNRDIFFAQQIASGASFPLVGPGINWMLHLGPLWYYLLALPLCLIPNAAAVTGFMAAISALQFPLSYELGRRVGGARAGILFALALALPGWMNMSFALMTHTIAICPSLLLGVLAALEYRKYPDALHAGFMGLACVLMLCAHPTLVLFASVLMLWCAARTPARLQWLLHATIVCVLVTLSLLPVIYAEWNSGFPDAAITAKYARSELHIPSPAEVVRLLHATLYFGPCYVARFLLEVPARAEHWLLIAYDLLLVFAGVGIVRLLMERPDKRALIGSLLALLLAQSIFIAGIRTAMPPWMVYAEWPLIAALIALGLDSMCQWGRGGRLIVASGLLITTVETLDVYASLAAAPLTHAEMEAPPGKLGIMDIRDYVKARYHDRLARIPFRQLFAIGSPLCEPVALFGHYAFLVDYTYAVSAWAACGDADHVQFGGIPESGRRALIGLHQSTWQQIGMTPQRWLGVLGIGEPAAIWHSPTPLRPVQPLLTTFPRELKINPRVFTISGNAHVDQAVLVSQRAHRYGPFRVIAGRIDGQKVDPVYVDSTVVIFRAPPPFMGKDSVHWDIDIDATSDYVDVLTLASR